MSLVMFVNLLLPSAVWLLSSPTHVVCLKKIMYTIVARNAILFHDIVKIIFLSIFEQQLMLLCCY